VVLRKSDHQYCVYGYYHYRHLGARPSPQVVSAEALQYQQIQRCGRLIVEHLDRHVVGQGQDNHTSFFRVHNHPSIHSRAEGDNLGKNTAFEHSH